MTVQIPDDSADLRAWLDPKVWRRVPIVENRALRDVGDTSFSIYAIISTWYESDIVEAAVRNCFEHGCDRVLIVDNHSPDNTRELAVSAGAEIAIDYTTEFYRDELRVGLVNQVMDRITKEDAKPKLWWLVLDCDEMIQVPGGQTLREYLSRLAPECTTVGAYSFDHYPTSKPANVPGFHPADFQPYGMLRHLLVCPAKHWKHPLIRCDNGQFSLCQTRGLHVPFVKRGARLIGPTQGLFLHHFMFRDEEFTRKRLTELCAPSDSLDGAYRSVVDDNRIKGEGAIKRFRNLDLIYSGRWAEAELCHAQAYKQKIGIPVKHWSEWMSATDYSPRLWYAPELCAAAILQYRKEHVMDEVSVIPGPDNELNLADAAPEVEDATGLALTQFLCFEICRPCNLDSQHCGKCPSADANRYGRLDTSTPTSDDTIVDCVRQATEEFGWRGVVHFHYYNEPLLAADRLLPLVERLKREIPGTRCGLWTNGTQIPDPIEPSRLSMFDQVWVSNYFNRDWPSILGVHVKDLHVLNGKLDGRKKRPDKASTSGCLRPFNELVIDHYGNGHLCCADWRGEVVLGNVNREGFASVVEQYLIVREQVRQSPLPDDAPNLCRLCTLKMSTIGNLVPEVATVTAKRLGARIA